MADNMPLQVQGFVGGITLVPRQALRLARVENPECADAVDGLIEETSISNLREGIFTYAQRAGFNLPNSSQILR